MSKLKSPASKCTEKLRMTNQKMQLGVVSVSFDNFLESNKIKHHDYAPAHNAVEIRKFLVKDNIAVLEQALYSQDLAPCDFFLLPKLKEVIKRTRLQDSEAIKTAVTKDLLAIPEESFQKCVEAWQRRLEKCIRAQRDYF